MRIRWHRASGFFPILISFIILFPILGVIRQPADMIAYAQAQQKLDSHPISAQAKQAQDTPAPSQAFKPTRTPRPTSTPIPIPPPPEPGNINLMILFGIITVLIILAGVLINRKELKNN